MSDVVLYDAIDKAKLEFWTTIAAEFPDVKTGDLSPTTSIAFDIAMEEAVKEWLFNNA